MQELKIDSLFKEALLLQRRVPGALNQTAEYGLVAVHTCLIELEDDILQVMYISALCILKLLSGALPLDLP